MKSKIRIKIGEEWKTSGGYRNKKYTTLKAVKEIVKTFTDQNIVPVVSYVGEYVEIAA